MTDSSPIILALIADLFFLSRVRTAAAAYRAPVTTVRRAEQLAAQARATPPRLVLIDMAGDDDWEPAIRQFKADPDLAAIPVVAFGPHVDHASQARARLAGADRVLSNRRFTEALPAVIGQYLGKPDGDVAV
jgi:CheY-like chemotaxis protein